VPRHFGYGPHPHHGDHFPRRPDFSTGASHTHFEPRHLDSPRFPHHGSRPTGPSGEVLKTVKASSGRMIKCWIPTIYLTNPNNEPITLSRPMKVMDRGLEDTCLMDFSCSRHMTGTRNGSPASLPYHTRSM
jgi:hypothetical protein